MIALLDHQPVAGSAEEGMAHDRIQLGEVFGQVNQERVSDGPLRMVALGSVEHVVDQGGLVLPLPDLPAQPQTCSWPRVASSSAAAVCQASRSASGSGSDTRTFSW